MEAGDPVPDPSSFQINSKQGPRAGAQGQDKQGPRSGFQINFEQGPRAEAQGQDKQDPRPGYGQVNLSMGVSPQKGGDAMSKEFDPRPRVGRALDKIIQSCSFSPYDSNRSRLLGAEDRNIGQEVDKSLAPIVEIDGLEQSGDNEETGAVPKESNWDRMENDETQGFLLTLLTTDKEQIEVVAAILDAQPASKCVRGRDRKC